MKLITLFLLPLFFYIKETNAQVGINTNAPKAIVDIEATSVSNPSAMDGILIPRRSSFPTQQQVGHTIFLENHTELPDGFYYFDGEDWQTHFIDTYDRSIDKSIYVFTGQGYSGTGGTTERTVFLSDFRANESNNFTLSNHNVTVGKSGKYLVMINSSLKKSITPGRRAIYIYTVKKNGSTVLEGSSSTANESSTAISFSMSNMISFNAGDVLNITVRKRNELGDDTGGSLYEGYGTNCLTLMYIKP